MVGGLNARLPADVAARRAARVGARWDARRSARRRVYRYRLRWGPRPALDRARVGHYAVRRLDAGAMAAAAPRFEGTHDFKGLSSPLGHDCGTVRTVERCRLEADPDGLSATLEIAAPSFLMHQVRRIVGALVEVGRGRVPPEKVFAARGRTAPPGGLTLVRVEYPPEADPFR